MHIIHYLILYAICISNIKYIYMHVLFFLEKTKKASIHIRANSCMSFNFKILEYIGHSVYTLMQMRYQYIRHPCAGTRLQIC